LRFGSGLQNQGSCRTGAYTETAADASFVADAFNTDLTFADSVRWAALQTEVASLAYWIPGQASP